MGQKSPKPPKPEEMVAERLGGGSPGKGSSCKEGRKLNGSHITGYWGGRQRRRSRSAKYQGVRELEDPLLQSEGRLYRDQCEISQIRKEGFRATYEAVEVCKKKGILP